MAAKKPIFISRHFNFGGNLKKKKKKKAKNKKTFPKEFFNEIRLKLGDHETLETSLICILLSASRDVHFDKRMIFFLSGLF